MTDLRGIVLVKVVSVAGLKLLFVDFALRQRYVSSMLLRVEQAARRLGVSPVTIRRWTATGFLLCTRTAGGHRRIDEHDIDDLAKAIGNSNHLAAQLAREREVDVLINTSVALAGKIDLTELLLEIAMRMTSLLDCHFCAISEYDAEAQSVITLAEYDHAGRRLPDASPYKLSAFPLTRDVLQDQTTAVVNVDDPDADPAEVAELRREGDRSLLMVPLIVQGDTIGILEVVDQKRSRQYSRQELRLAGAIAGQAAVAIKNAKLFAERRRSDEDVASLRRVLTDLTARVPSVSAAGLALGLAHGPRELHLPTAARRGRGRRGRGAARSRALAGARLPRRPSATR
jgi:excisionase family DNA binding protein